jgi:hypothetical protein
MIQDIRLDGLSIRVEDDKYARAVLYRRHEDKDRAVVVAAEMGVPAIQEADTH